jgi:hypothetical protein
MEQGCIDDEWERFISNYRNSSNPDYDNLEDVNPISSVSLCAEDEMYAISMQNKLPEEIRTNIQPLYISTCTKIFYLNVNDIDVETVFWNLPVINYGTPTSGIIKKQIMIKSKSKQEVDTYIYNRSQIESFFTEKITKQVNNTNANARKNQFKDARILTVGMSKKDIMNCHSKDKKAFINCFAVTMRIFNKKLIRFCEMHMKIFNTGKVTVPGIVDSDDDVLEELQQKIVEYLRPFIRMPCVSEFETATTELAFLPEDKLPMKKCYIKDKKGAKLATVTSSSSETSDDTTKNMRKNCRVVYTRTLPDILINSNFNCGFHILMPKFKDILETNYGLQLTYNKVHYPGIKCRYYLDNTKPMDHAVQTGIVDPADYNTLDPVKFAEKYTQVTFIPFRTGRSLILGSFPKRVLLFVYEYVCNILVNEYQNICNFNGKDLLKSDEKQTKPRRRTLSITPSYKKYIDSHQPIQPIVKLLR